MIDKRPVLIHWWKIVIRIIKKVMGLSKKEDICLAGADRLVKNSDWDDEESDGLVQKRRHLFRQLLSVTSVHTGHHFALFSRHTHPPPSGGGATGRDSLESKVTFIQPTEWVSLLECVTDKDIYSGGNSPESGTDSP